MRGFGSGLALACIGLVMSNSRPNGNFASLRFASLFGACFCMDVFGTWIGFGFGFGFGLSFGEVGVLLPLLLLCICDGLCFYTFSISPYLSQFSA